MNNIIENNKLIAAFMNVVVFDTIQELESEIFNIEPCNTMVAENLKYHKSWDWLMPVVDKITDLTEYYTYKNETGSIVSEGGIYINSKYIESTYNDVVAFIEWYTQNK